MKHWSSKFVGIPWLWHGRDEAGADCWGVCRLVYQRMLNIEVPAYSEACVSAVERAEIASQFDHKMSDPWVYIKPADATEFDIAVFSFAGRDGHAGVVLKEGSMLHVQEGLDSCIENYATEKWRRRLSGIYRHRLMVKY